MRFLVISQKYLERVSKMINQNHDFWSRLRDTNTKMLVVHVMTEQLLHTQLFRVILSHWRLELWSMSQIVVNHHLHHMRINISSRDLNESLLHVLGTTANVPSVLSLHFNDVTYLNPLLVQLQSYPFTYCLHVVLPRPGYLLRGCTKIYPDWDCRIVVMCHNLLNSSVS